MSLIIEVWGIEVLDDTPEEFKARFAELPPIWWERKSYMMHEYQNIKPHQWTFRDYQDLGITHNI